MPVNMDALKDYNYIAKPVATGVVITAGSLCANVTATGMLTPFVIGDVANYNRVYIAKTGFDNTLGANGVVTPTASVRYAEVYTTNTIVTVDFDAIVAGNTEANVYGLTADSCSVAVAGPVLGRLIKVYSATRGEILLT